MNGEMWFGVVFMAILIGGGVLIAVLNGTGSCS